MALTKTSYSMISGASSNVLDFGADPTGTTDSTSAVQAAVNSSNNVYFPRGTYVVRNVLVGANTHLHGDSDATVKLKVLATADYSPIFNIQGNNVSFKNLKFDGNRASQPAEGWADAWGGLTGKGKANRVAIYGDVINSSTALSNITVVNCEFTEFYGSSIATRDASNILVDGCRFTNTNFEACFLYQQPTGIIPHENATIVNCTFKNIASGDAVVNADIIVVSGYSGVVVSNNYADNFERLMVKLEISSNVLVSNNVILNATLFGGIGAQAGGDKISFVNNVIKNCGNAGIGFTGPGGTVFTDVVVDGNIVENTGTNLSIGTPDGIILTYCKNAKVSNNQLRNIRRAGIGIQSTLVDGILSIENNDVSLLSSTAGGAPCSIFIGLATNMHAVSINNNICNQNSVSSDGTIAIVGSPNTIGSLSVVGNTCRGAPSGGRGIYINNVVATGAVTNNTFSDGLVEVYATGSVAVKDNVTPRSAYPSGAMSRLLPHGSAAPTTGTYYQGDVVLNLTPTAGGNIGWVCTTGGTPGTWKTFGAISA